MDNAQKAETWSLLSRLFEVPDPELVEALSSGNLAHATRTNAQTMGLAADLTERVFDRFSGYAGREGAELLSEIRIEYTRLFIGPPSPIVSTSEGAYRLKKEGDAKPTLFINAISIKYQDFLKSCGIHAAKGYRDVLDSVSAECECAFALLSSTGTELEPPRGSKESYRMLLENHLALWLKDFSADLEAATESDYYRGLALLLSSMISRELAEFGIAAE